MIGRTEYVTDSRKKETRKADVMWNAYWRCGQWLSECAEGCYKHFVKGKWVCCKCGK